LPGATLAISPVTSPLRKRRASSPATLTTPRSGEVLLHAGSLGSVSIVSCQNSRRNVSAVGRPQVQFRQRMADTYDLILKGGTVVNHDGEGVRDLAFAAAGFRRSATVARVCGRGDRLPGTASPAGRDRHPGSFPRARPHPQGRP
jgi:hypothetical protein